MAQRLKDIRVRKIDLVGVPAIGKPIVLFKSEQGVTTVDKKELLAAITELDDVGKQEVLKALGVEEPIDPVEVIKGLDDEQRAEIAKLLVGEPKELTAEDIIKAIEALKPKDDDKPVVPEEVTKAITGLSERLTKADERATKAEEKVAELEKARRREGYIAEVGGLAHLPGVTADDFAPILEKADAGLTDDERKKLREVLKGADAALESTAMLREFGSGGAPVGDAAAEVEALAVEVMKANGELTKEQARAKVMDSRPDLATKVLAEEDEHKKERG
jgi:DNA-binding transcriptional ArsR family regulator